MNKKSLIFAAALAVLLFSLAQQAVADHRIPTFGRPRAVMIIMDKVTWADLAKADAPNLKKLAKKGSIGLLSNRTAKPETTSLRSYLTIGTGARADGEGQMGYPLSKARFRALVELNRRTGYGAKIGLLATALHRRGLNIAAFGNADAVDTRDKAYIFGREVALIGVDENGAPPPGETSGRILAGISSRRAKRASGLRTDYERLLAAIEQYARPGLIVIETGDTRRADMSGLSLDRSRAWLLKKTAIRNADRFIGRVARRLDFSRDLLIVVAPSPPLKRDGSVGRGLTPIIVAGKGIKPGQLSSPSTRRAGLVTSTDIAPTLADYFSLKLGDGSIGRPITSLPGEAAFSQMAALAHDHLLAEEMSKGIILSYSYAEGVLLALIVLGLILAPGPLSRAYQAVRLALLLILSLPLGIFIGPLLPFSFSAKPVYVGTILVVALSFAIIAWLLPERTLSPLIFLTGTTALFVIVNLLAGGPAEPKSAFGYTAITGGRFYGIGNEFLSVFVPAVLVAVLLGLEKRRGDQLAMRLPVAGLFAFIVFMVGYGGLGANTGGIILTTPALTLAYCGLFSRRPRWAQAIIAAVTTVAALSALAVIDAVLPGEPTHLGQLTRQIDSGTPALFVAFIKRKVMLNVTVFDFSHWSYVVIGLLVALIIWHLRSGRRGPTWAARRHPNAGLALISGLAGGVAGALSNDSGIAILAIVLGYLLMVMLYLEVSDRASAG
ncbi:MAG: hypothetical protein Q8L35_06740 [Actinomycetota bacterium]|nr:hypothetical protein [Actinomycetota bacterium]